MKRSGRSWGSISRPLLWAFLWLQMLLTSGAGAQALNVEKADNGTEIITVTQPLAEASVACWPVGAPDGTAGDVHCVEGSELTFLANLEHALTEMEAPPVLVVVGGSVRREVSALVSRVVPAAPPDWFSSRRRIGFEEGGQERKLGPPGVDASLRLELPLPSAELPERTAVEVLWALIPKYLRGVQPGLRSRLNGETAELEAVVDAELIDLELSRLRLGLAQLAGDPVIEEVDVNRRAHELNIQRLARLEDARAGATLLVDRWVHGKADAVREFLFGPNGVTLEGVKRSASTWLPQHPGRAVMTLPPRVFRPRFAPGPMLSRLDNDVAVAILERPSVNLSALVVRPVLLTGLSGEVETVVLTRLAAMIRSLEERPPYVSVQNNPPRLEIAASLDAFPSLCEALQGGLSEIVKDKREVTPADGARSRAKRLMGGVLGLDVGNLVTPAAILAPGNLAIGGVASDAEAAGEALQKLGVGGEASTQPLTATSLVDSQRRRLPAAGTRSAAAIALPAGAPFPIPELLAVLLKRRADEKLEGAVVEMVHPLIPGRKTFVMVVEREGDVDSLEADLLEVWPELLAPVTEVELEAVQRQVASEIVVNASGVLGRARECAAVAAGEKAWRAPSEMEMTVLTADTEGVNELLLSFSVIETLEQTASGPLEVIVSDQ